MPRYFIKLSYKGTRYSGFQTQQNAITVQGEIEQALQLLLKEKITLTGSSRTDRGVHALQNYFHFDWKGIFADTWVYNMNAILPSDIVILSIQKVNDNAHCRFDAMSRTYNYHIYNTKNPFLNDVAYFYPYPLNIDKLNDAAALLLGYTNFTSFSKKNTQVKTNQCIITASKWEKQKDELIYEVTANRFLRGMVRALTATMLKVGRGFMDIDAFKNAIETKDSSLVFFDAPAHGLFLTEITFPPGIIK